MAKEPIRTHNRIDTISNPTVSTQTVVLDLQIVSDAILTGNRYTHPMCCDYWPGTPSAAWLSPSHTQPTEEQEPWRVLEEGNTPKGQARPFQGPAPR
ncbi:hypothetical protein NUU61_003226 [Penicillium alfredii]|uniref:Uncharacterized protein n=1 Tax=Penicillium alfredii TaxID=1506179 RepID=A0A9W9FT20_9EURO|nr:uncharacterized protein NUU61_003226 [Penicillium alfredii]KAJ5105879.1 hypothetical protein NUU61_003226 [Penicillium alfredii]